MSPNSLQQTSTQVRYAAKLRREGTLGLRLRRRNADQNDLFSQPSHPSLTSNHRAKTRMNTRFFLRTHPQENRENVEKSEISEAKNKPFGEKLALGILRTFARNDAITGLQRDKKRGQRKSAPLVNGGAGGI